MLIKVHDKAILSTLQQLTDKDLVRHGRKVIPLQFFVFTFHDEKVEEHKSTPGYDFSKWSEWLEQGRVYIEKLII